MQEEKMNVNENTKMKTDEKAIVVSVLPLFYQRYHFHTHSLKFHKTHMRNLRKYLSP